MKTITILLLFTTSFASACTAFFIKTKNDNVFVFKNYDWHQEPAYILTNPKNVLKKSLPTGQKDAVWKSKYSSLTVNQYGKEFPIEGVNEMGLLVQTLILPEANYTFSEEKPCVNELQFIQYQLDNFSTVNEVLGNLPQISIVPITANVHYFIVDKSGDAAVIDFVNGKLQMSRKNVADNMVLANSPYQQSVSYWKKEERLSAQRHSLNRFCAVQNQLTTLSQNQDFNIEKGFSFLETSQVASTQWSTAYDLQHQKLYFKTKSQNIVKTLDWSLLDFSKTFYFPLISNEKNEVSTFFTILTKEKNYDLLKKSMNEIYVYQVENDLNALNNYQIEPNSVVKTVDFKKHTGTLHVRIEGLRNNSGTLRIAYANSEERYVKKDFNNAIVILPNENQAEWTLYNLPFGDYVFGLHHDKNGDDKFNNFLGIPTESFGFSNNARGFLGFPKYRKAVIKFETNKQVINIKCK